MLVGHELAWPCQYLVAIFDLQNKRVNQFRALCKVLAGRGMLALTIRRFMVRML